MSTNWTNELLVGGGTTASHFSAAGPSYRRRVTTSPNGDIAEDRSVTKAGSYDATAPLSASGAWVMQLVTFRAAGSPAVPVFRQQANIVPQSGQSVSVSYASAAVGVGHECGDRGLA